MTRQTSFQLTPATEAQLDALKTQGFGTTTDIIRIAIDRMFQQECPPDWKRAVDKMREAKIAEMLGE